MCSKLQTRAKIDDYMYFEDKGSITYRHGRGLLECSLHKTTNFKKKNYIINNIDIIIFVIPKQLYIL